jgi:hypothetical protein
MNKIKIELNIGLKIGNVGKLNVAILKGIIEAKYGFLLAENESFKYQVSKGKYNGNSEPTLIVEFYADSNAKIENLPIITENLCKETYQDCIPFLVNFNEIEPFGLLIYNPCFEGQKYLFDQKYFLHILSKNKLYSKN